MSDINSAWNSFCGGNYDTSIASLKPIVKKHIAPKCGKLYISTRTIISYLFQEKKENWKDSINWDEIEQDSPTTECMSASIIMQKTWRGVFTRLVRNCVVIQSYWRGCMTRMRLVRGHNTDASDIIDLKNIFWKIPIIPYQSPREGIIKKQMKFISFEEKQLENLKSKISATSFKTPNGGKHIPYVDEYIITRIVNPEGRIKFKDVRKISIGLCKRDITSHRCKKKSAFYNCFVVMLRVEHDNIFKEIHVKVFNTGQLEIPGIQSNEILNKTLNLLTDILNPLMPWRATPLIYLKNKKHFLNPVLINSNFNCGYFINREKLFDILKLNYGINSAYDPCSYPGIQSQFFYDNSLKIQNGRQPEHWVPDGRIPKVSFMIFRTGSVLIVGKCSEEILNEIYNFLRTLLEKEYINIKENTNEVPNTDNSKKSKTRKKAKTILVKLDTNK
tara:strand:- start:1890 stop:3224 length:1335 start_codon:yes stop_codon:yes gene_type:complete